MARPTQPEMRRTLLWLALAQFLSSPVAADACVGDCDGNGVTTRADVVTGVRTALAESATCPPLVIEGQGITVDALVRAVNDFRAACGLADRLVGIYDAGLVFSNGSSGENIGIIGVGQSGLYLSIEENVFNSIRVQAAPVDGDSLVLEGYRIDGGDVFFIATGTATVSFVDGETRIDSAIDTSGFGSDLHIDALLRRPSTGTPARVNGNYTVAFSNDFGNPTARATAVLPVQVSTSGVGTCGPLSEHSSQRTPGEVAADTCYVSPGGQLYFLSEYTNPAIPSTSMFPLIYILVGEIAVTGETSGTYMIGYFPGGFEYGWWQSVKLPGDSP